MRKAFGSFVLFLAAFSSVSAMAAPAQRYDFKFMNCQGPVESQPSSMHNDYRFIGLRLISFQPSRRDGSLAKSVGWNTYYGHSAEEVKQKMRNDRGSETWYTGRLALTNVRGKLYVTDRDGSYARDKLKLQLVRREPGKDILRGTYERPGSVVGDISYQLVCVATNY